MSSKKSNYEIFVKEISKRMDELESYIKKQKFHDVLDAIENLEKEYEQKAYEIVTAIAKIKESK